MRSTAAAVALGLLLAASPATADELAVPPGWSPAPEQVEAATRGLASGLPDDATGRAQGTVAAVAAYRPTDGGALLVVTRVELPVGDAPDQLLRARVDDVRAAAEVLAKAGAPVTIAGWQERTDAAARLVEARLEWTNAADGIAGSTRAVWTRHAADGGGWIAERRVECLVSADATAAVRGACAQAAASLVLPAVATREPLAVAAAQPAPAADAPPDAPAEAGGDPARPPPSLRAAPAGGPTGAVLADRRAPTEPARDLRPLWVMAGLAVIAAAMWWNRQQKRALAAAEAAERRRTGARGSRAAPGDHGDDGAGDGAGTRDDDGDGAGADDDARALAAAAGDDVPGDDGDDAPGDDAPGDDAPGDARRRAGRTRRAGRAGHQRGRR